MDLVIDEAREGNQFFPKVKATPRTNFAHTAIFL